MGPGTSFAMTLFGRRSARPPAPASAGALTQRSQPPPTGRATRRWSRCMGVVPRRAGSPSAPMRPRSPRERRRRRGMPWRRRQHSRRLRGGFAHSCRSRRRTCGAHAPRWGGADVCRLVGGAGCARGGGGAGAGGRETQRCSGTRRCSSDWGTNMGLPTIRRSSRCWSARSPRLRRTIRRSVRGCWRGWHGSSCSLSRSVSGGGCRRRRCARRGVRGTPGRWLQRSMRAAGDSHIPTSSRNGRTSRGRH